MEKQIFEVQTWRQVRELGRSGRVRNPGHWHQVSAVAHVAIRRAGGGGHEGGLPAACEEDASETSQDGPLEVMGSQAQVWNDIVLRDSRRFCRTSGLPPT